MIKLKLGKIVDNVGVMKELMAIDLPVKMSYSLSKLASKIDSELKIYNEKNDEIIKSLGTPNETGEFTIPKDNPEILKDFKDKWQELRDIEVEIDFTPLKIEDLGNREIASKLLIDFIFE